MITIGKIFWFSAGHHLPYHEGQCKEVHGHNYKLEVEITGPIQTESPAEGMIMDFNDLDKAVNQTIREHDHKNLNDIYPNPTAEIMVERIAKQIKTNLYFAKYELLSVKLWETEKCYAEWVAD